MAIDCGSYIFRKIRVHYRCRVFGQERDAIGNGPVRWIGRMDYCNRRLAILDDHFGPGAHPGQ